MKFKFDVLQQYKTIFERDGEIGYKEANNYEMALSAGQFFLVAQMRPPISNNSSGFLLEYKIPGYSEILKEEIFPNKIFKSEPITIREDVVEQSDGRTTKRIIVTQSGAQQESTIIASHSIDDYKNVKICITGINREKLVGFNVKILQSLGVREFRMHRDRIEQMETQSFREIMEQAIVTKNVEDLKLMLSVVETKGYAELIEYGKSKLTKLQKALDMRERVNNILLANQYEDASKLKETLEELYTIRDYHTVDDFEVFDKDILKLEQLLKQSQQDRSLLESLNGVIAMNDSKKMEEAKLKFVLPNATSTLIQNRLKLLDTKIQQVKQMETMIENLNLLLHKKDLKPLEKKQMESILKQCDELPLDLQSKCSKLVKKANKKLALLEKNSKTTKELTRIIVEEMNPKKIVGFVIENKAYLSEEDIKKADIIAAKIERGEKNSQEVQEFRERREVDLLLEKTDYSDDEEGEEQESKASISDEFLKQLEYDSEDESVTVVADTSPVQSAASKKDSEIDKLLMDDSEEEAEEKSRNFKIQKKETSADANATVIKRNRSGTRNNDQNKIVEKKEEPTENVATSIPEVIPTEIEDYSEYDDEALVTNTTKDDVVQNEVTQEASSPKQEKELQAIEETEEIKIRFEMPQIETNDEVSIEESSFTESDLPKEESTTVNKNTSVEINTISNTDIPSASYSDTKDATKQQTKTENTMDIAATSIAAVQDTFQTESVASKLEIPSIPSDASMEYGSDEDVENHSLAKKVLDGEKKALFADKPATKSNTIVLNDAVPDSNQQLEEQSRDADKKVRFDLDKNHIIRFDSKAAPRSPSARRPSTLFSSSTTPTDDQKEKLVQMLKEGEVPIHFQRRNLSSHALTDKLHNCIIKMMQATTDNIVTRETQFVYNVITCLEDILLYRTKKKYVFFKERTVYDIFKGFKIYQVQAAMQYFELHNLAKKESYQSESLVFIQFLCETADMVPFILFLMKHPEYTTEVYYTDSLIHNTKHHDDLISVLSLLQQLRFEFGYIPMKKSSLQPSKQNNKEETVEDDENTSPLQTTLHVIRLKQLCKGIVELYMASVEQKDEYFGFKLTSIVRTSFCQELLYLLSDDLLYKSYAAGPFHFWEIIEYIAMQCQVIEIQDLSQLLESNSSTSVTMSETHSHLILTVKQVLKIVKLDIRAAPLHNFFKFKLFVCVGLNTQQLGNYMELFFYHFGDALRQKFYGKNSFMAQVENRKRIISFCKTLCKLPFRLQLDHEEIYQKVNSTF